MKFSLATKLRYAGRCVPAYAWQRLTRAVPRGKVHLMIALADHFEPSALSGYLAGYAAKDVQQERMDQWCSRYPRNFEQFRDSEGRTFNHTYFYPAEQYDRAQVEQLANLCHSGWGEIEIHLHHGLTEPTTFHETKAQLVSFRDALAHQHGCLAYEDGESRPRYAFVHGNFTLANCANGFACGVDDEMQLLAETGCYVDMTFPTAVFHPAQVGVINSIYECGLPLDHRAPHSRGRRLQQGRAVRKFPFLVQGPWMMDFGRSSRGGFGIENGALTKVNPPSVRRLELWKNAAVAVDGKPEWIFIKLHTHGMDPTDNETILGDGMRNFLRQLVEGAAERNEILHFVSAREMANVILAACDGREGNPGDFRDYRYKVGRGRAVNTATDAAFAVKN